MAQADAVCFLPSPWGSAALCGICVPNGTNVSGKLHNLFCIPIELRLVRLLSLGVRSLYNEFCNHTN